MLYLSHSNIQAYAGEVAGSGTTGPNNAQIHGGNIALHSGIALLSSSFISGNDLAPGGKDGNIFNSTNYFLTNDSVLHATGTIESTPPDIELDKSLVQLSDALADPRTKLQEECQRSVGHEMSTFVIVGRNGTETAPDELQPDFGLEASVPSHQ
jgi:hypothetical protein